MTGEHHVVTEVNFSAVNVQLVSINPVLAFYLFIVYTIVFIHALYGYTLLIDNN